MSNWEFFRLRMNINGNGGESPIPTSSCSEDWYESLNLSTQQTLPTFPTQSWTQRGGIYVDEGGTRLYMSDGNQTQYSRAGDIWQFSMSTPHDITTLSFVNSASVSFNSLDQGQSKLAYGLHFSSDGTKLYRHIRGTGALCRWDLSTAWDITSINTTPSQRVDFAPYLNFENQLYTGSANFDFTQNGVNLIIGHDYVPTSSQEGLPILVKKYTLSSAWDLTSINDLDGDESFRLTTTGSGGENFYGYGNTVGFIDSPNNNTAAIYTQNLASANSRPVYQFHNNNSNYIGRKDINMDNQGFFMKIVDRDYLYGIGGSAGGPFKVYQSSIDWTDTCMPPSNLDYYNPITPTSFKIIGSKSTSPFWGVFTTNGASIEEVSTGYTLGVITSSNNAGVIAASDNYTHLLAGGTSLHQNLQLSNDGGRTWADIGYEGKGYSTHMSKDGKYMAFVSQSTGIYTDTIVVSQDYGSTWTEHDTYEITGITQDIYSSWIKMSSGGKYIIGVVNPQTTNNQRVIVSTDYGSTFSDISSNVFLYTNRSVNDILISGNGKYQHILNTSTQQVGEDNVNRTGSFSEDYGQTWSIKMYPNEDWDENGVMDYSGQYSLVQFQDTGSYNDNFLTSTPMFNNIPDADYVYLGVSNFGKYSFLHSSSPNLHKIHYSTNYMSSFTFASGSTSEYPYIFVNTSTTSSNTPTTMSVGFDGLGDLAWYGYYSASISPQSVSGVALPDGSGGFGQIGATSDALLDNNTVTSILWYGDYNPGLYPPFILSEEVSLVLKGTSTPITTWNTMSIQSGSTITEYYRDQATGLESGSFTMGGGGTDDFLIYSWDVNFDTDGGPIGTGNAIIDFLP